MLYAYVMQGEAKQAINYEAPAASVELLFQLIDDQDEEGFKQALEAMPTPSNLALDVLGFSGQGKRLLIDYAMEKKQHNIIKIILDSKHCTLEFLASTDGETRTALMCAIERKRGDVMKMILEHKQSNKSLLSQTNDLGLAALDLAFWQEDLFKILLECKDASPELLMPADKIQDSFLNSTVKLGNATILRLILDSPHCTYELLHHTSSDGLTVLNFAAARGNVEMMKLLLASPYCNLELIELSDNKYDKLSIMAKDDETAEINSLIEKKRNELKSQAENTSIKSAHHGLGFFSEEPKKDASILPSDNQPDFK